MLIADADFGPGAACDIVGGDVNRLRGLQSRRKASAVAKNPEALIAPAPTRTIIANAAARILAGNDGSPGRAAYACGADHPGCGS